MNKNKLQQVLDKHIKLLTNKDGGEFADLSWADLHGADLSGVDLTDTNLSGAYLDEAYLAHPWVATFQDANYCQDRLVKLNMFKSIFASE